MVLSSKKKYIERYKTCLKCEHFIVANKKCNQCGCNMKIKVRFDFFKCPLEKW